MKIAIDLDDVLALSLIDFIDFYNEKFEKKITLEDFTGFSLNESIGMPIEKERKLLEEYDASHHYDKIKPMEGAKEAIKELSENHELVIVTSRPQKREEQTRKWLENYIEGIKEVFFIRQEYGGESKTKGEVCKEIGAELLIEDNLDYAESCVDEGIRVLLFDYPYNQEENISPSITRVKSWKEVLKNLKTSQ